MKRTVHDYYELTKPGIIYANALAAFAGFMLASGLRIDIALLFATIVGVMGIIASACVANNILDRSIDKRMKRTKKRALVSGVISKRNAFVFCIVLGIAGFGVIAFTNMVTLVLGIIAYVMYVAVYGYFKRRSVYGTLVGSVSGALPPVAGYTAVTGQLDIAAVGLFIIMTAWQMPHFYAIAMFRRDDYANAKIPVLPVVSGMKAARHQIIGYILVLTAIAPLLTILGKTGITFAIIIAVTGIAWLTVGIKYYKLPDALWARRMFFYSLGSLFLICFAISTGTIFA